MVSLKCPECGSSKFTEEKNLLVGARRAVPLHIVCNGCRRSYPVIFSEIIDFHPLEGFRDPRGHSSTYSYSSRLYETWRKSRFLKFACGVSFREEMELLMDRLELTEGLAVLDVACGTGVFARDIAGKYASAEVWGLDYSYSQLRQAAVYRERNKLPNLRFVHALAQKPPFADQSFDRVFTVGALHYFGDIEVFFKEVHRILKPGGKLIAASYLNLDYRPSDSWFIRLIQKTAIKTGVHFFSKSEVTESAEKSGFVDLDFFEKGIMFILAGKKV